MVQSFRAPCSRPLRAPVTPTSSTPSAAPPSPRFVADEAVHGPFLLVSPEVAGKESLLSYWLRRLNLVRVQRLTLDGATTPLQLLVVTTDGVVRQALPGVGSVRIGRADGNDLRLDDASVSRQHAVLYLQPEPWLEDLGGSNGTALRRGAAQKQGDTEK